MIQYKSHHVRDPEISEILFCGIQNLGLLQSRTQPKESGIPANNDWNLESKFHGQIRESGIHYLKSGIHDVESRVQDCLNSLTWGKNRADQWTNFNHSEVLTGHYKY